MTLDEINMSNQLAGLQVLGEDVTTINPDTWARMDPAQRAEMRRLAAVCGVIIENEDPSE
jgi:hypothetical protein